MKVQGVVVQAKLFSAPHQAVLRGKDGLYSFHNDNFPLEVGDVVVVTIGMDGRLALAEVVGLDITASPNIGCEVVDVVDLTIYNKGRDQTKKFVDLSSELGKLADDLEQASSTRNADELLNIKDRLQEIMDKFQSVAEFSKIE